MNALTRFAFGRPVEEERAVTRVATRPLTALVARFCLAAIFVLSGIMKLAEHAAVVETAEGVGIPSASILVTIAAIVEIGGGLAILTGFLARFGALALMGFLVVTTYFFHDFWTLAGEDRSLQMAHFLKNLAIFGGLLLVVADGAGRYSFDRVIGKRLYRSPSARHVP